ncbi:hypothetical protein E2C01_096642 [Portunus trituberculatus]|uniref:Uncharacterized protein n=1 Tax=Portunus trituberculatus TaxID=210409 RepID=A0A5B7K3L3_PORTR|nr:hypothetical protein [Portunus trituberculatus]
MTTHLPSVRPLKFTSVAHSVRLVLTSSSISALMFWGFICFRHSRPSGRHMSSPHTCYSLLYLLTSLRKFNQNPMRRMSGPASTTSVAASTTTKAVQTWTFIAV